MLIAGEALAVCLVAALVAQPRHLRPAAVGTGVYALVVVPWILLAVRPNVHPSLANYWRGYYLDGDGFAGGLGTRLQVLARGFQGLDARLVLLLLAVAAVVVVIRRPLVGALLVLPIVAAVVLAALEVAPLGTGRTDVYLFPSLALLVAVAVAEVAAMLAPRARWATGAIAGLSVLVLVIVVLAATPTPAVYKPCVDPPVIGSKFLRCAYPPEDLTPLVRKVEGARLPGDKIVVYSSAGYSYGLATRHAIDRVPDALSPTAWVVKVRDPNIVVLEPHRKDPEKWSRSARPDHRRLTARLGDRHAPLPGLARVEADDGGARLLAGSGARSSRRRAQPLRSLAAPDCHSLAVGSQQLLLLFPLAPRDQSRRTRW